MGFDISNNLYKIGTGWIFDADNKIGYRVERSGEPRKGRVESFIKAFTVTDNNGKLDINYDIEVPIGVVRKAIHILEVISSNNENRPE